LSSKYSNVTKQLYLISKFRKQLKPGLGQGCKCLKFKKDKMVLAHFRHLSSL